MGLTDTTGYFVFICRDDYICNWLIIGWYAFYFIRHQFSTFEHGIKQNSSES